MAKTFRFGKKFAWGDTVQIALEECTVDHNSMVGECSEVIEFTRDCHTDLRVEVCEAIGADTTFLRLPDPDKRFDDDENEDDEN